MARKEISDTEKSPGSDFLARHHRNETSATHLCTAIVSRVTEERALKRYLDMESLNAMDEANEGEY